MPTRPPRFHITRVESRVNSRARNKLGQSEENRPIKATHYRSYILNNGRCSVALLAYLEHSEEGSRLLLHGTEAVEVVRQGKRLHRCLRRQHLLHPRLNCFSQEIHATLDGNGLQKTLIQCKISERMNTQDNFAREGVWCGGVWCVCARASCSASIWCFGAVREKTKRRHKKTSQDKTRHNNTRSTNKNKTGGRDEGRGREGGR